MALEDENNIADVQKQETVANVVSGTSGVSAPETVVGEHVPTPPGATQASDDLSSAEDPFMRTLGIASAGDYAHPVAADVNNDVASTDTDVPPPVVSDVVPSGGPLGEQVYPQQEDPAAAKVATEYGAPMVGGDLSQQQNNLTSDEIVAGSVVPDSSSVVPGTITVNGTLYAVSIFWQPLQNSDNPLPEVRDAVTNVLPDADLYVLRVTGVPQYGLGLPMQGHKAGMPVAALAVLDVFSNLTSVVAVFKVPEGWWFLAIRNGLILSEEDVLYTNEEDAKRSFLSMMAVPDWERKIAPDEWNIEGVEAVGIDALFTDVPKVKLLKLKKELSIATVAVVVGILVLLGIGAFALLSRVFNTTEVIQEVVAPPPVVKPVVEPPKIVRMPMPWESLVVPSEFIKVCSNSATLLTSSTIPGWTIGDIRCQETGLSTSWSMQWGRVGNFLSVMNKYKIEGLHYTVAKGGRSATGTIHFNQLRKAASTPTMTVQEITDELTDMFQAIAMPIQISVTDVGPSGAVAGNNRKSKNKQNMPVDQQVIMDAYSYVNFSFSSSLPVSKWSYFFDKFGALELTSLLYNKAGNNWKYEGRIYGKNE